MRKTHTAVCALLLSLSLSLAGPLEDFAAKITPLIDPAKLATLKERGANPRVQKYAYWLERARQEKAEPRKVAAEAARVAGYQGQAGR